MRRKIMAVLAALAMTVCSVPMGDILPVLQETEALTADAVEEKPMSGTCGENVTWLLDDEGTLKISGYGEMECYNALNHLSPFRSRDDITSIKIEEGVTCIGDHAFEWCDNLKSISIPDSVTSIGRVAFEKCTSLTNITIPNGVTEIKSSTFRGCTSLTSVTIPDSVTLIDSCAFEDCSGLTSVLTR